LENELSAPRKDIEDLKLSATPSNLNRALKRNEAEAKATLTPEQESEIAQLDALIAQAMKACKRGQTVDGKRNPAFANLESLVKVRRLVMQRPGTGKKSTAALLKEMDKLLKPGVN
jgi:hypothetical protein